MIIFGDISKHDIMSSILLKNIYCNDVLSDIYIEGTEIKKIIDHSASVDASGCHFASGVEVMDCGGKTAIPGFINMHTHAAMSLMRGVEEDVLFHEWLAKIWEIESKIDADYIWWGTKVACLEMIKTGTTTYNNQYWYSPVARKAAIEMGIRPVESYVAIDHNNPEETAVQKEEVQRSFEEHSKFNEGGLFEAAFHSIYSVSEELMLFVAEFARKHGLKLHIHLCETEKEVLDCKNQHGGLTPVEYLDRLGILGPDVLAAHTLWLSDNDIELLGKYQVNCVHNVNSNTKLSSGYKFKYNELRDAGANVCIGTDGCASSNNLDILEAMKTAALFQKSWRHDPKALPLNELFDIATVNGAKALGLNTGKLEEGACADILVVNTDSTFFLSPGSFLSNLIYSAHSDCIEHMIAGGKFVMRNRKVKDEGEILAQARIQLEKIR